MKTDRELLDEYLHDRSDRVFEAFFGRHYDSLAKKVAAYIKNEDDRKDFLQNFWIAIFKDADRLKTDAQGSAARYLSIMCLHDLYDFFKAQDWDTVPLDDEVLARIQHNDDLLFNNVEYDIYYAEIQAQKQAIVDALPDKDRLIYTLHEKYHYDIPKIALYSCLSEGTIKNKLRSLNNYINNRLRPVYYAALVILLDAA